MKRIFRYLRPYRSALRAAIAFSVTNKVLDLMPPLLVGWVIDSVRGTPPAWISQVAGTGDAWGLAIFLSVLAVLIFGLESLFEWLYQRGFMRLAQRVQHDLRLDTYRHMQNRELAFFEKHRIGDTLAILNDDINQLERFLNTGFNDLVQLGVLFVFAGAVLLGVSWQLALIGMAPLPFILWGSLWYQKKIAPRYAQMRSRVGELGSRLENNISGIPVIKSFTAEDYESERVEAASAAYREANFDAIKLAAVYVPLIRMLVAVGFGGVLLLGSYWVLNDMNGLTVGELVLFSMMIQRLLWPITRLGQTLDNYERARASARRVFGLLDQESQVREPENPAEPEVLEGKIQFDHIHFGYRPDLPVLRGLDFEVQAGETVGLAGTTGSGKSTLVKLLLRFYDVGEGAVRLDGVDVRDMRTTYLRRQIAWVSQDVYLFHGTILENIAYGTGGASRQQVEEAARMAQLHDFILTLPEGYETLVGERGIRLSGGQRQRLSIARALLKDAPILILDEATSSVDTETERAIQQNLERFTEGRTALIIAHRLSTIRRADRILVLGEGHLAEQGKHEDLLAQNGIYADLWRVQTGESAS